MNNIKRKIILVVITLLIFSSLNIAKQIKTGASQQTPLWLVLDIKEIKIKDIREWLFDDRGEFYFYRYVGSEKVRLPLSGEIKAKKNDYLRPSDENLADEPFWHLSWEENSTSQTITFIGNEKDEGVVDDDMGTLSVTLDLSSFQFLLENTNRKMETNDYHIVFTIKCAPLISSTTHPDSNRIYYNPNITLDWTPTRPAAGILGYSYLLDNNCCSEPDSVIEGTHTSISYTISKGGDYWFHVKVFDKLGCCSTTGHFKINIDKSIDVSPTIVNDHHFQLYQNYPNPFNATTVISYQLANPNQVNINIFNLNGRQIKTLTNSFQSAGLYKIIWDGKDNFGVAVSSGMYTCVITVGQVVKINKMTLLR